MRDNPLIIGLLIGLIVILVIAGVSLLVKMNSLSSIYKKQVAKNINSEKAIEDLKEENAGLTEKIEELSVQMENSKDENVKQIKELQEENMKLEELKNRLEESLKEELMKKKLAEEQQ